MSAGQSDENDHMTAEQAEAVWAVLVEECGASRDYGFVHHQTHEYVTEWRFIPRLVGAGAQGHGGPG